MTLIVLAIVGAIALYFRSDLKDFLFKPKSAGRPNKPKLQGDSYLTDFLFKPKSTGKPHKPKIRWKR
ncbi:MAG: hypothetical protein WCD18_21045 [Thermosynechococcaceae cyanobacterium]